MLKAFASYLTYDLIKLDRSSLLLDALNFFIYDTIKIFLLLAVIIFIVSISRCYFPLKEPNASFLINGSLSQYIGCALGTVTLFCSCSDACRR